MMDREEARLKRSPLTIKDKALTSYLTDLVCRLSEGHCPDIRVYPVRVLRVSGCSSSGAHTRCTGGSVAA